MKQKVNTQVLIKNFGVIFVLLLSFWAIKPLFVSGFFPMHDDTQVARVFEMGKALKDGMLPVRWVPDLGYGYGYPIFNFYAPLAYYVGGVFVLLGFDALVATKIMMVLGVVLSGIFMYLLAREFWGEIGGVLSGLFYVYAPYHALDIYVRGDVAEFWAYAFIPLMFWGFYKVFNSPRRSPSATFEVGYLWKWVIVGSFGYAGVILSHNLTAMMVTPFLAIVTLFYCYIAYRNKKIFTIYYLLFTILLGLALSAFYWLPALLEMKYTNVLSQIGGGADFGDHFVCINQLWESNWGFGGSIPGCIDGVSFRIGKLHLLSVSLSLFTIFTSNRYFTKIEAKHSNDINHYSDKIALIIFGILGFIVSIFFMLEISRAIWEAIPAMAFFQYPWRFLLLASFFSSFLSGSIMIFLNKEPFKKYALYIEIILIVLLINFNIKLFNPQTILPKISSDYTNEYALKWTASKISDEFLSPNFKKPKSEYEVAKKPLPFKETSIEKASNLVSLIGVLVLIIGIILFS